MKVNKIINSTVEEELEITGATLLSVEEAKVYLTHKERAYNACWWLCSPGLIRNRADCVSYGGDIRVYGYDVLTSYACVRPALILKNFESSNFEIGDTFKLGDFEFKVISENLAWMHKQDIGHFAFNEDYKNGNNYETSDIKKIVDSWFYLTIKELSSTDVVEVKHEQWIITETQYGEIVTCPCCGARPRKSEYGYYLRDNFCPECGEDMRGETNG